MYVLDGLTYRAGDGEPLPITDENGVYSFIMPDQNVTVYAEFMMPWSILQRKINSAADGGTITDNTAAAPYPEGACNLVLRDGQYITIGDSVAEDTLVGVTTYNAPTEGNPIAITSGLDWDDADPPYLFSDSPDYRIGRDASGEAALALGAGTITIAPAEHVLFI